MIPGIGTGQQPHHLLLAGRIDDVQVQQHATLPRQIEQRRQRRRGQRTSSTVNPPVCIP
ncbi:MAG TPA: hypothetical protein PKM73_14945 [Verrucomicrobiota bacterium]|nr:hypothetical protein [Verrucomicrobiota bacterium]HNU52635.1 hypothetical protein [Verrucomicrobiota bacterium]